MQGIQAVAVLFVKRFEHVDQADTQRLIIREHLTDQERAVDSVLVPNISAAQIAIALFHSENIAAFLSLLLQKSDLLSDELEACQHIYGTHSVSRRYSLCQIGRHDRFDKHGILRHRAVFRTLSADIIEKQHSRFVS